MTTGLNINYDYTTNGMMYGTDTLTGTTYTNYTSNLFNTESLEKLNDYEQTRSGIAISNQAIEATVANEVENILSYLYNGQEDYALQAYNSLLEQMASNSIYATLVDSETGDNTNLKAYVRQLFEQEAGTDLASYIKEYTKNAAAVERQQIKVGENLCDSTTQEDLLYEMCNLKENESQNNWFQKAGAHVANVINPANWNWAPWFSNTKRN